MLDNRDKHEVPLTIDGEPEAQMGKSPQYASGGALGMQMAAPSSELQNPYAEIKAHNPSQEDFLMIQLSSFEGRAGH